MQVGNFSIFCGYRVLENAEAVPEGVTLKTSKKISQNWKKNTCVGVSFLIKLQAYEICEIFINTFLKEHLRLTTSWFLLLFD